MKELEDHEYFPSVLRNFQTDYIGFVVSAFKVYNAFIQHIKTIAMPSPIMSDLCSGSGEPAISIFRESNCFKYLTFSDKYPNELGLCDNNISYKIERADVITMEFKPHKCYTMFNAFHHFTDEDKLFITQRIQASGAAAFIVEILEPTITCMLKVLFTSTLGSLLLMPFVKPFSITRLFFTYIIPINVFTITFDGVVSVFKSRSADHYRKLFTGCSDTIEVFRLKNGISPLIVIQINIPT